MTFIGHGERIQSKQGSLDLVLWLFSDRKTATIVIKQHKRAAIITLRCDTKATITWWGQKCLDVHFRCLVGAYYTEKLSYLPSIWLNVQWKISFSPTEWIISRERKTIKTQTQKINQRSAPENLHNCSLELKRKKFHQKNFIFFFFIVFWLFQSCAKTARTTKNCDKTWKRLQMKTVENCFSFLTPTNSTTLTNFSYAKKNPPHKERIQCFRCWTMAAFVLLLIGMQIS